MPVASFSPVASVGGYGDAYIQAASGLGGFFLASQTIGTSPIPIIYTLQYWRFELDLPAGAQIAGFDLRLTASTAGSGGASNTMSLALLKPDGLWNQATAWLNYGFPSNFPRFHNGTTNDLTVCHDDTLIGSGLSWNPGALSIGDDSGFWGGDGVTSRMMEVPGMPAHLQDYLETNEALRGTGVGAGIPVCFSAGPALFSPASWSVELYQSPTANTAVRPLLTVAYYDPEAVMGGRATSDQVVSGRVSMSPTVSGRASSSPVVSGRASS